MPRGFNSSVNRANPGRPAALFVVSLLLLLAACGDPGARPAKESAPAGSQPLVERDIAIPMRDGVILRADVFRPPGPGPFPVLVYRTPYGKTAAEESYDTHLLALRRGYAVVLQDVRGRYASDGRFEPYRNEGRDGFDTIEWAAAQPWSDGRIGTWGLSYPGAVQWLAARESPPHLRAMVPAMTFSSPRNFFYMNGVFDLSWLPWLYVNIAPDARDRMDLPGLRSSEEAAAAWPAVAAEYLGWLPLADLPYLHDAAPYYFDWLRHAPEDAWWDWAEIRGHYGATDAAVMNLSGWYDEAYGPEGAVTNFNGLVAARRGKPDSRTQLLIGPWSHGVGATGSRRTGDVDFGAAAAIDYDKEVLDFFDHYLRGLDNRFSSAPPVRYFMMGENRWHQAMQWPPANTNLQTLYLTPNQDTPNRDTHHSTTPNQDTHDTNRDTHHSDVANRDTHVPDGGRQYPNGDSQGSAPGSGNGDSQALIGKGGSGDSHVVLQLSRTAAAINEDSHSSFVANPRDPVVDPYGQFGPHDYQVLAERDDLLTFDSLPFEAETSVVGAIEAVIHASCDCRDFDLWVRIFDVYPDGRVVNLMSPGNDMLRASYRGSERRRISLEQGRIYTLRLPNLLTANRFLIGHRLRVQISASFAPHFSRNLQTGESEVYSSALQPATINIYHDSAYPSHVRLPVADPSDSQRPAKPR